MSIIVEKFKDGPKPEVMNVEAFKRPQLGERMKWDVVLTARSTAGLSKEMIVQPNNPGWSAFKIICDEGTTIGGADEAPAPLCYFVSGVGACLLTHLSMYAKSNKLDIKDIRIELKMGFSIMVGDGSGSEGRPEAMEIHVIIDSEEPVEKVNEMYDDARENCFALQSIMTPISTEITLHN